MTSATTVVARTEWTLLLRSGTTTALVGAFVALTACAIAAGAWRSAREGDDRSTVAAREAAPATRGAAHFAMERGTFAVLPAPPLAGFAVGQSDIYPAQYHITARSSDAQLSGDQLEPPLVLQAGAFDLLFVLLYLYPLLLVAISHDLVATDRATGTLRMLVSQGASVSAVVRGRVLTRVAFMILLPVAASVTAALAVDAGMLPSGRFALWTAGAMAYGAFWVGLAVWLNAGGRSATTNAVALTALWVASVMLVPSAVNVLARLSYPVPSRVELATALRQASRDAIAQGSSALGRYLEDHPASGTGVEGLRQFYALQEARDAEVARQLRPLLAAYQQQLDRQAQVVSVAQFASPTIVAQLALTDLAGTSGHRARAFSIQASAFQLVWKARFPADVLAEDAAIPEGLPAFVFEEEPFSATASRTLLPLGVLSAASGALLWSGLRKFRHLEVVSG